MPRPRWLSRPASICVGAIAGGFGVQGEVRLKSFCADARGDRRLRAARHRGRPQLRRPAARARSAGAFAARLTGVATREEAEALKGTRLYAPRDRLPPLPEDEFYHADLIGLAVLDTGGAPLGTVRAVLDHGAGDILEIARPGAARPAAALHPRGRPDRRPRRPPHRRRPARGTDRPVKTKEGAAMATVRKEILTQARPEQVWDAIRDIGALHTRLVPGFVVATRARAGRPHRHLRERRDGARADRHPRRRGDAAGLVGRGLAHHALQRLGAGRARGRRDARRLDRRLPARRAWRARSTPRWTPGRRPWRRRSTRIDPDAG